MASDLQRTRYVTANYRGLQGLRIVPWSVVFGLWALGESGLHLESWWLWSLTASVLAAPVLTVALGAYYRRRFGRVQPLPRPWPQVAALLAGGVAVIALAGVDQAGWLQTPVSVVGLALAAGIVAMYWGSRPYAGHHLGYAAVLAVLSLVPLGGVAPIDGLHPLSSAPGAGAAVAGLFLVGGLGDHRLLTRTLHRGTEPR